MRSQFVVLLPHLENGTKLCLLLLSQLSEVSHIISVIHLMFCIEIIILKLDVGRIVNVGLLVFKVLHSLTKILVLGFFSK